MDKKANKSINAFLVFIFSSTSFLFYFYTCVDVSSYTIGYNFLLKPPGWLPYKENRGDKFQSEQWEIKIPTIFVSQIYVIWW